MNEPLYLALSIFSKLLLAVVVVVAREVRKGLTLWMLLFAEKAEKIKKMNE